jgi:acyl-homoserine lactone acylase PvdQ
LANNPHIDARRLPGIWHPVALITPEFRVVGAAGPGTPGFAVARTSHIAFGVTNSNGDGLDLFIEREDPERPGYYLEGERSLPFETIEETLLVRDRSTGGYREQPLVIRLTRRGPVISDHGTRSRQPAAAAGQERQRSRCGDCSYCRLLQLCRCRYGRQYRAFHGGLGADSIARGWFGAT